MYIYTHIRNAQLSTASVRAHTSHMGARGRRTGFSIRASV